MFTMVLLNWIKMQQSGFECESHVLKHVFGRCVSQRVTSESWYCVKFKKRLWTSVITPSLVLLMSDLHLDWACVPHAFGLCSCFCREQWIMGQISRIQSSVDPRVSEQSGSEGWECHDVMLYALQIRLSYIQTAGSVRLASSSRVDVMMYGDRHVFAVWSLHQSSSLDTPSLTVD